MRKCILLTGLQRNFEPFIENQLNLVINKYNLDVFIFTSDLNSYRYRAGGNIDYIIKENYNNNENLFKSKYKNLKDIGIDFNDTKFKNFINKNSIKKCRNHTVNMISSYFKVTECIKLMEKYEKENEFKYDIILRCRLDFFTFYNFFDINNMEKNKIYFPISKFNRHKDDSGILLHRDYLHLLKNFINVIINYDDKNKFICIESELFNHFKKNCIIEFIDNLSYRIGVGSKLSIIPYVNKCDKNKFFSLEYPQEIDI